MRSLLVPRGLLGLTMLCVAGAAGCASEKAASVSASRSRSAQALPSSDSDSGPAHVVDLAREFHDSQCANGGLPVAQCPGVRRVRLGEARVNGALSSEIVRRVVQRHVEELRQCYEREPGAAARRAGSLRIVFSVSPEGQVQAAKVEGSTLDAAGLDGCLVKSVGGWIFPAPAQGSVEVSYPLFFEAG